MKIQNKTVNSLNGFQDVRIISLYYYYYHHYYYVLTLAESLLGSKHKVIKKLFQLN